MDVFSECFLILSIKEKYSSKKKEERNRFLSKGMSNIYSKATIEKNWRSQGFNFLSLKNLSPGQFFGSFNSRRY